MRLRLLAVGTRMPGCVEAGIADYVRRLGPELRVQIEELALRKLRKRIEKFETMSVAA